MKEEDETTTGEFGGDEGASAKAAGAVTDSIRKAVFGGLSALFVSEEGIRQTIGELPKDALSFCSRRPTRHVKNSCALSLTSLNRFCANSISRAR